MVRMGLNVWMYAMEFQRKGDLEIEVESRDLVGEEVNVQRG
jgi:hypothetical protein